MSQIPSDAPLGRDTPLPPPPPIDWEGRGVVIPINPDTEDQAEGSSSANDSDQDKVPEKETTWHDVALSIAAEMMDRVRRNIHEKLGYTTSAVSLMHVFTVLGYE